MDLHELPHGRCLVKRRLHISNENEKDPFSVPSKEETMYFKERGVIITEEVEVPNNIFCYSNKTLRENVQKRQELFERCHGEAIHIINMVDPIKMMESPQHRPL